MLFACNNQDSSKNETKQQGIVSDEKQEARNESEGTDNMLVSEGDHVDMVHFEGGDINIGSEEGSSRNQPVHKVVIEPFYLDKGPVSVAQFALFISKTGYLTEAERFGDSGVYGFDTGQWSLLKGAYWKFPLGPNAPEADPSHPVTHISWNDANAYAQWAGKRLPSEYEWEFAARNGSLTDDKFPWGNQEQVNGKYMANTWQGENTSVVSPDDGYLYTSPIGVFGETPSGLVDMSGNVWEWCSDVFKPYTGSSFRVQITETVKSIRGGSFMFDELGSESYSVYGRSFNSAETSLFNMGFRCAMD